MNEPVRVGVVGGGAWSRALHIPMHRDPARDGGFPTALAGVWARSPERRAALAAEGLPVVASFAALLDVSDAIDFAVPPAVQAELAPIAARAGKAVLLEKPLALGVEAARAVVESIEDAGVAAALFLTRRYLPSVRSGLARAATAAPPAGVVGMQAHGGFLAGGFVREPSPWRDELGALYDLGPHVLDLGEQLAGPIDRVRASEHDGWVAIDATHVSGALGRYAVSGEVRTAPLMRVTGYGSGGVVDLDSSGADPLEAASVLREEFALAVRSGAPVTVDARRGFELAALLDACAKALDDGTEVSVGAR